MALADEPDRRLECQDRANLYFQAHRNAVNAIRLDSTLKGCPDQWLEFVKAELDSARSFATENGECIDMFIRSVRNSPEGEGYGWDYAHLSRSKYYKEKIEPSEDALGKVLQEYIRARLGLCVVTVSGQKYTLLIEEFIPPLSGRQEESRQSRHAEPPLDAAHSFHIEYGQRTVDPTACEIWITSCPIPETKLSIAIPVFWGGRYVCEIEFEYCVRR
jgi:hypothetical protein